VLREFVAERNREERTLGVPDEHRTFCRIGDSKRPPLLVLHGAGGSPADYDLLADYLVAHGWSLLCPLLPGHGLDDEAAAGVAFDDLLATACAAHDAVADRARIAVIGQSYGAVLAIRLAAQRDLAGLVALAPALRPRVLVRLLVLGYRFLVRPTVARKTLRWHLELKRGIDATIAWIPNVTCPLCVLHSSDDPSVRPDGARLLHDRAASARKNLVILKGQGHTLARAPNPELVYPRIVEFLAEI
jgi:carboxylesterase